MFCGVVMLIKSPNTETTDNQRVFCIGHTVKSLWVQHFGILLKKSTLTFSLFKALI